MTYKPVERLSAKRTQVAIQPRSCNASPLPLKPFPTSPGRGCTVSSGQPNPGPPSRRSAAATMHCNITAAKTPPQFTRAAPQLRVREDADLQSAQTILCCRAQKSKVTSTPRKSLELYKSLFGCLRLVRQLDVWVY